MKPAKTWKKILHEKKKKKKDALKGYLKEDITDNKIVYNEYFIQHASVQKKK